MSFSLRPQDFLVTFSQRSRSSTRSRSSKNENCGKLSETCGELKISFSKFPYRFDIFSGLSHFVTAEHRWRGAMYLHASRYFLIHTWAKNTCSSHYLCGNQVVLLSKTWKLLILFILFPYCGHLISRAVTNKR